MTPEQLATIAGIVLSLLFKYFPGLNTWFAGLTKTVKRLVMLGLLLAVGLGAYGLSCVGLGSFLGIELVCDQEGLWALLAIIFSAGFGNQLAFLLAPETKAVEEAKAARG